MAQLRHYTTEFIQNDKARLATFRRRSHCLLKKASQLSILCDVDVAVLIYADHLADCPLTFPPESSESLRIIKKSKANPRYVAAAKSKPHKYMNSEHHTKRPNYSFGDDISSLNAYELESLVRILDAKEEQVVKKINAIKQRNNESVADEETTKSKSEQLIENSSGFQNQVSGYLSNNYNDELMSLNVFDAAIGEISDPNCFFFGGDGRQASLLYHQQHGFPRPVAFSVMGNENTATSNSEQLTENNFGFLNQFSGHLNSNYDNDITNLKASESASMAWIREAMEEDDIGDIGLTSNQTTNCLNIFEFVSDEFADPNLFFFSGDGRPIGSVFEISKGLESELFDYLQRDFQTASSSSSGLIIPCPHQVEDDTPISESHDLTESNSWLLDPVLPIMEVEPEDAEGQSKLIVENTLETTERGSFSESSDCESLAAMFYEEAPGLDCLFYTSEIPMYHEHESLDY